MADVKTPRGAVQVSDRELARARERMFRLPPDRRSTAGQRAQAVLARRDSRRAAAIVAAVATLAALAIPTAAV